MSVNATVGPAVSWLGFLIPALSPQDEALILIWVFPFLLLFSVVCGVVFMFLLPGSAWVRLKARCRGEGVLVSLFTDEGYEKSLLMKSDLGQGILSGRDVSYIFTPRPPVISSKDGDLVDITHNQKRTLDEALSHRMHTDTGKPLYIGYVGKSVGVTHGLLRVIKKVHDVKKFSLKKIIPEKKEEPDEQIEDTLSPEEEDFNEKHEFRLLELLDPRLLKLYIGKTISRSLIESIKAENERKGYLRRPASLEFVSKNPAAIGVIIVLVVIVALIATGAIDIMGLLGGVPSSP